MSKRDFEKGGITTYQIFEWPEGGYSVTRGMDILTEVWDNGTMRLEFISSYRSDIRATVHRTKEECYAMLSEYKATITET